MTAEKEILTWAKALDSLSEGKGKKEQKEIVERLIKILQRKRKAYLLPRIVKKLEIIYSKKHKAELFLARDHSTSTAKEIKSRLSALIGKGKYFEVKIEKGLIGGFRAKTSNLLVKASIKDFLDELKWKI